MTRHDHSTVFQSLVATLFSLSMTQQSFTQTDDAQSLAPPNVFPADNPPQTDTHAPELVEFSPDGEHSVLASPDGRLKYVRTSDGATLRTFYQCHPRIVAFSPDGLLLVSAGMVHGSTGRLKVWNLADGMLLCQIKTEMTDRPLLCFSPDGHVLAGTGPDSRLNLWQLPQGEPKWSATLSQNITRIGFAGQGRTVLVTVADGSATRFPVP